jgi:hypothetical protein
LNYNNSLSLWNFDEYFLKCRVWTSAHAPNFLASEEVVMSEGNDYRQQVEEAAARVAWCERKLLFERKRHRALKDLATTEDWLDGKVCPLPKTEGAASEG